MKWEETRLDQATGDRARGQIFLSSRQPVTDATGHDWAVLELTVERVHTGWQEMGNAVDLAIERGQKR